MNSQELKIWNQAVAHTKSDQLATAFEVSDKYMLLRFLFRKTASLSEKETDPVKKRELDAYSEGFRHAINIMRYRGDSVEAYRRIINSSIKIELTEEDVLDYRGVH